MFKSRSALFAAILFLAFSTLPDQSRASHTLRLGGFVASSMAIETEVGRGNRLHIRSGGNQAEALEIRIEGGPGRAPALSRVWRISAKQLLATYHLPVAVLPGSRVILSAP